MKSSAHHHESDVHQAALRQVLGGLGVLRLYERFEQVVVLSLAAIIAMVTLSALWGLAGTVFDQLVTRGPSELGDHKVFQGLFGMIMTVIIALEFSRATLLVGDRQFGVVQARVIVLIGLLALVRKLIILDLADLDSMKIISIGAASLALGLVYWLVRDQDNKERRSPPASADPAD